MVRSLQKKRLVCNGRFLYSAMICLMALVFVNTAGSEQQTPAPEYVIKSKAPVIFELRSTVYNTDSVNGNIIVGETAMKVTGFVYNGVIRKPKILNEKGTSIPLGALQKGQRVHAVGHVLPDGQIIALKLQRIKTK